MVSYYKKKRFLVFTYNPLNKEVHCYLHNIKLAFLTNVSPSCENLSINIDEECYKGDRIDL